MQLSAPQRRALASRIKAHMKQHSLSFVAFGERAGINGNTLSRLTDPSKFERVQSETRAALVKAMGKSWESLTAATVNGHAKKNGNETTPKPVVGTPVKRMLVIEVGGSKILVPSGVEVSILDESTIRIR